MLCDIAALIYISILSCSEKPEQSRLPVDRSTSPSWPGRQSNRNCTKFTPDSYIHHPGMHIVHPAMIFSWIRVCSGSVAVNTSRVLQQLLSIPWNFCQLSLIYSFQIFQFEKDLLLFSTVVFYFQIVVQQGNYITGGADNFELGFIEVIGTDDFIHIVTFEKNIIQIWFGSAKSLSIHNAMWSEIYVNKKCCYIFSESRVQAPNNQSQFNRCKR